MTSPRRPRPVPWIANLTPAVHGSFDPPSASINPSPSSILDFSANGNVIGPSPRVAEAVAAVDLSRYPDRSASRLRTELAAREQLPAESVVAGNGSTELIWALARAYLAPEDRALVLVPTYGEYEVASRATGATVASFPSLPLDRSPGGPLPLPDAAALAARLRGGSPRLVWLGHPNNPTGRPAPLAELRGVIEDLPEVLFVVDEAYLTLCETAPSAAPLISGGNVGVLRSLTKDLGLAGLRAGYLLAAPEIADVVRRVIPPWSVSSVAQAGAVAALADPEHLDRARTAVAASRAHLTSGLKRIGLHPYPSVANFVLVSVGSPGIAERLLARGFAVRDCASFGLPDCIRIGVRSLPEQDLLLAALAEVLRG